MSSTIQRNLMKLALVGGAAVAAGTSLSHAADRSGKEIVEAICIKCHETGVNGAPRIGNTAEWSARAKYGLDHLLQSSIDGVRNMPAHGGEANLSDLEMSRAIAYMVSGGKTADPDKPFGQVSHGNGQEIFERACTTCHLEGKNGAPKFGDKQAWLPRLQKGLPELVKSAVAGHNKMPARGGFSSLSDVDIRSAVAYMANKAAAQK